MRGSGHPYSMHVMRHGPTKTDPTACKPVSRRHLMADGAAACRGWPWTRARRREPLRGRARLGAARDARAAVARADDLALSLIGPDDECAFAQVVLSARVVLLTIKFIAPKCEVPRLPSPAGEARPPCWGEGRHFL